MTAQFEFVIYDNLEPLERNGEQWFYAPFHDHEIEYLKSKFKENIDFIIADEWSMGKGHDVLINTKIFSWLTLTHGTPYYEGYPLHLLRKPDNYIRKFLDDN